MAVYFIRAGEDGPVKIGSAERPDERLRDLQCGNATELTLMHVVGGWGPAERQIHKHYADRRIRGEWFQFCPSMSDVETFIDLDLGRDGTEEDDMTDPTVTRAIKEMGSATKLAAALGITRSAVSQWRKIPTWHLKDVSRLTGIPVMELLPAKRSRQ
jgi:hypothetical protein